MRYLYLTHRWLGLVLGPLVILWLLSGLVMLFVKYPSLDEDAQLAHAPPLQRSLVHASPAEAWQTQHASQAPQRVLLGMQQGRPVYYFLTDQHWQAVWADTAEPVSVTRQVAAAQALQFQPASGVRRIALIDLDQWSFSGKLNAHRPLFKVSLDDAERSELYVSSRTGQVVLTSTQQVRFWNWLGSITHWIYFTELRAHREVWRQVVLWPSAAGLVLAMLGLWAGIQRMRLKTRYSRNRHTPYQGWMRWHHLAGYGFGAVLVTWLLSGWLSMTPMNWLSDRSLSAQERQAWQSNHHGQAADIAAYTLPAQFPAHTRQLEWQPFAGQVLVMGQQAGISQRLHPHTGKPLPALTLTQLQAAIARLQPGRRLHAITWLDSPGDAYYRVSATADRIARASFSGDNPVTYYIHAANATIVASQDTRSRYYRWLFTALHTWDFPWIAPEFWRKLLVILLSLCGLVISITGLRMGIKRHFQ